MWSQNVDVSETLSSDMEGASHSCSQLFNLNLAHNNFSSVPVSLACLAVNLTRLNMSFNKLSNYISSDGWKLTYSIIFFS
jgi:Leucine-rich repeat (LRR) protein